MPDRAASLSGKSLEMTRRCLSPAGRGGRGDSRLQGDLKGTHLLVTTASVGPVLPQVACCACSPMKTAATHCSLRTSDFQT